MDNPGFRVRKAGWSDLEPIMKLARSDPWTKAFPGRNIAENWELYFNEGWVRVAETISPDPIGYLIFRPQKREKYTKIHWMGVAPECRRIGVGARLLQQAWMFSPDHEIRLKVAQDNETALAFYKRFGFTLYGRQDTTLLMRVKRDDWWEAWNQTDRS